VASLIELQMEMTICNNFTSTYVESKQAKPINIYFNRPDGTSSKRLPLVREVWGSNPEQINLSHVANNSQLLQRCCVDPGAKPRRWAPLTRDTRKGIM